MAIRDPNWDVWEKEPLEVTGSWARDASPEYTDHHVVIPNQLMLYDPDEDIDLVEIQPFEESPTVKIQRGDDLTPTGPTFDEVAFLAAADPAPGAPKAKPMPSKPVHTNPVHTNDFREPEPTLPPRPLPRATPRRMSDPMNPHSQSAGFIIDRPKSRPPVVTQVSPRKRTATPVPVELDVKDHDVVFARSAGPAPGQAKHDEFRQYVLNRRPIDDSPVPTDTDSSVTQQIVRGLMLLVVGFALGLAAWFMLQ